MWKETAQKVQMFFKTTAYPLTYCVQSILSAWFGQHHCRCSILEAYEIYGVCILMWYCEKCGCSIYLVIMYCRRWCFCSTPPYHHENNESCVIHPTLYSLYRIILQQSCKQLPFIPRCDMNFLTTSLVQFLVLCKPSNSMKTCSTKSDLYVSVCSYIAH